MLAHAPAPCGDAGRPQPSTRIAREISDLLGAEGRALSPIDAVGKRRQKATRASGMGFGRTGAICEKDKIMQILPGSSNDAAAYKRVWEVLQSKGLRHPLITADTGQEPITSLRPYLFRSTPESCRPCHSAATGKMGRQQASNSNGREKPPAGWPTAS